MKSCKYVELHYKMSLFVPKVAVLSHLIVGENACGLENKSHESEMTIVSNGHIRLKTFINNILNRRRIN